MFLVLGILIVLFMITIKIAIEPAKKITRPGEFDANNIRNEFSNVQKYSESNATKIQNNIDNFTGFIIERFAHRKIDLKVIYVNAIIDKSNTTMVNITVGNGLGSNITNVNVSFGNASGSHGSYLITTLGHRSYNTSSLSFVVTTEEKHINMTYTNGGKNHTLFYIFTPKNDTMTVSTLFDVSYAILDKTTKDRLVQTDYR